MQVKSYYKIVVLFLAVLVILVGFILYQDYFNGEEVPQPAPTEYGYGYQEPFEKDNRAGWLTHDSDKWGYSIQYPDYLNVSGDKPGSGRIFYDIESVGEVTSDNILEEDKVLPGSIEIGSATISGQWSDSEKNYIMINLVSVLPQKYGLSDEESARFINTFVQKSRVFDKRQEKIIVDDDVKLGDYNYRKILTEYFYGTDSHPIKYNRAVYFYKDLPGKLYVFSLSTDNPEELGMFKSIIATFKIK